MRYILSTLLHFILIAGHAQNSSSNSFYKARPKTFIPVNDFAGMLTPGEKQLLSQKLLQYSDTSGNVVVIITQKTLQDTANGETYQLEEAAKHYFNNWGIGRKEKNNGVLFFVVKDDRKIRITTGSGLETVLTNEDCQFIIDNDIIPNFKSKHYFKGLDEAVDAVVQELSPDIYSAVNSGAEESKATPVPDSYSYQNDSGDTQNSYVSIIAGIIFIVIVLLLLIKIFARARNSVLYQSSSVVNTPFLSRNSGWTWLASGLFLNSLFSSRNNNSGNNSANNYSGSNDSNNFDTGFSSGSSDSFSASSDSGSSFGGGSSDGGGASGSW
jgi:uncharacterized protein